VPLTVGDVVPFSVTITDTAGAPANGGTVTLTVTQPDGTSYPGSPFTVVPSPTGQYDKDVLSNQAGRLVGYWLSTGANAGSETQVFDVRPTSDPGIISLAEAKAHLNIPAANTRSDDEILGWIQAITPVIENRIGPVIPRTVVERVDSGYSMILKQTPVLSVTSINPWLGYGTPYSVLNLRIDPDTGVVENYTGFIGGPFEVTYRAGRIVTPANVIAAAKIILKHLWETQRGASALPLDIPGDESIVINGFGYAVPNRALELLQPDDTGPGVG
jgi:hypothetical protein